MAGNFAMKQNVINAKTFKGTESFQDLLLCFATVFWTLHGTSFGLGIRNVSGKREKRTP